jgi:hypothetical protein
MLVLAWIGVGVALWNGVFDLYVSRGVREYLMLQAQAEAAGAPAPSMPDVLWRHRRDGLVAASIWAAAVAGLGLFTLLRREAAPPAAAPNRKDSLDP